MGDLEAVRVAAMAKDAFAPALRAIELQGRYIGLWRNEEPFQGRTLEQMIEGVQRVDDDNDKTGQQA